MIDKGNTPRARATAQNGNARPAPKGYQANAQNTGAARPAPKGYQAKKHIRWPTRIVVAVLSVGGMLGLWQFVAHEPAASAHSAPSFQDAEQQLQLGNNGSQGYYSSQNAPSAPNVISSQS